MYVAWIDDFIVNLTYVYTLEERLWTALQVRWVLACFLGSWIFSKSDLISMNYIYESAGMRWIMIQIINREWSVEWQPAHPSLCCGEDICRASCNSKLPVGAANFFSTFVGRHSFILNLSTSTSGGMLNFLLEYCRQFVNHCIPLLSSFLGGPWNKYMPLIWRGCPVSAWLIVDGCWFDGDGLRGWSIVMLRACM